MSAILQYDEEAACRLEAMYTTPDVVAQRRQMLTALNLRPRERVLDVGVGPGFLAQEMAEEVGSAGQICSIDISESMLAIARKRCAGYPQIELATADATLLPFPADTFDAAISTQVYEYIADVPAALAELYRVLRPGGRALILDTDWDSIVWNASDRALQERILRAWDEHGTDSHLPCGLSSLLREAGFRIERREVIVLFNPEYDHNTFSIRVSALIAGFVAGRQGITQHQIDIWLEDLRTLGEQGRYFFSLNRYLFLAAKPGAGYGWAARAD